MTESLRELVVDALRRSRKPQRTARIAQACGVNSTYGVAQVLRTLQDERLVAAPHAGYWQWIGPLETRRPSPPPTRGPAPSPTPSSLPHQSVGKRWLTFRALCRYYAECVRLEERARLSVPAQKQNQEFLQLTSGIDWAGLSAGRPSRLMLGDEELVFIRRGLGLKRHPRWFLGGPVDLYSDIDRNSKERWTSLQPIFVIPIVPELNGRELHLHPTGPVEINHGWLQKRFRDADQRNEFLAAVGLAEGFGTGSALSGDDEEELGALPIADFRDAYRSMTIGYRSWWREAGNLERLASTPPLAEAHDNGIYNRALLIVGPALKYGRRLVEELYEIADQRSDEQLDQTALGTLFPHEPAAQPQNTPSDNDAQPATTDSLFAEYTRLNDEQRLAVDRSLSDPLTVLTGPPGTGKSVVVAHVMLNLALAGRSALFASRNHQAIEAVEPKLNALVEPEMLVMRPSRPFGAAQAQKQWQQALLELLAKPKPEDAVGQLRAARERLQATLEERAQIQQQAAARLDLQEQLTEVELQLQEHSRSLAEGLHALLWQESDVPKADVVNESIAQLESCLRQRQGVGLWHRMRRLALSMLRLVGHNPLRLVVQTSRAQLAQIEAFANQETSGDDDPIKLLSKLRQWLPMLQARSLAQQSLELRSSIELLPKHTATTEALQQKQEAVQTLTIDVAKAFARAAGCEISPEQRERFAELRAGQENHQGTTSESGFQKAFAKELPGLLKHFPLWATSNLSAHRASPLQPAAFDLLIIDEASQCDIASVVPLLFRAKRALAVGDPMQLRHVSQMPKEADLQLRARLGLVGKDAKLERFSVKANSFYDLASSSRNIDNPLGLRAHYRCHPEIAGFCNDAFYNGQLRIMTDRHRLKNVPGATNSLKGCEWTDVRGRIEGASSGCHSPELTDAVVVELERLALAEFDGTVGVVTPFRVQADRIRDQAHQKLPRDLIERWRLLVHTVDGFQGDERDIVLFALTGGPNMPPGSRSFLASTPNRCNVAVSRARSFLRVLGNRSWAATCGISFVQALDQACARAEVSSSAVRWDLVGPVWEPLLAKVMRDAGLPFVQQYLTCGYYLDFALLSGNRRINVEVDGETYHRGPEGGRRVDDLFRDFTLRAAGWDVLRFWVYELREDLPGCIAKIQEAHGARS